METNLLTGADALVQTLADCGVTHCFANPGTSEMHLVQALDREARIKSVLCLFEGVASGAADGFARIAEIPAMNLLHLGPGYSNAGANIHNAKKGYVPMLNIVGDHATYHRKYEAPLTSDIETWVAPTSIHIDVCESAENAGEKAAKAFEKALAFPHGPVSLLLPADVAWNLGGVKAKAVKPLSAKAPDEEKITTCAKKIQAAKKPIILVGSNATWCDESLKTMQRLNQLGIRIMIDTFHTRLSRGEGRFEPDRFQYFGEMALADTAGCDLMVFAGTSTPIAFFAYPEKPSVLVNDGCETIELTSRSEDTKAALANLAKMLDAPAYNFSKPKAEKNKPTGSLTPFSCAESLARHMPDDSIICDDAVTCGLPHYLALQNAARHDWLFLTGGAIGHGLAMSIGTAMAAPKRKTFSLNGDGASMYVIQSLWTMAREKLPIVVVIFANRNYRILNIEMARTGAGQVGHTAQSMLSLDNPAMDFVKIANGMGVNAISVKTAESYDDALKMAISMNEPFLIEAVLDT